MKQIVHYYKKLGFTILIILDISEKNCIKLQSELKREMSPTIVIVLINRSGVTKKSHISWENEESGLSRQHHERFNPTLTTASYYLEREMFLRNDWCSRI